MAPAGAQGVPALRKGNTVIDTKAIHQDCERVYGHAFGACTFPRCTCVEIPVKHTEPDAEMQAKIRDKTGRGDYT